MNKYKYRARLPDGRMKSGIIEAEDPESAQLALEERSLEVYGLERYAGVALAQASLLTLLNRIKPKDLVIASRTLSVMVSAAVPIPEAVRNIAKQSENPTLRSVMLDVANELEGGARLSDSLERHPNAFSGFYINMVRSGETSGQLGEVLEYLADQQEKDFDLTSKIKGAMIYPAFIISAMGIVGFVMMTFVVPKLTQTLQEAGVELPWTTKVLIAVSGFFVNYWYIVILLFVGSVVGFQLWVRTPGGKYAWDKIKMNIPVFGTLYREVYVVRFCRSLATLSKGGVDLVGALEVVADVMDNAVWKQLILETIQEVNDGNSIATAFQKRKFVPTMMNQMLVVGEGTGRTSEILGRLSNFYSREIDNMVENMTKLIEPLVIMVLGAGVGVLVSAILLPLYQLSSGAGT